MARRQARPLQAQSAIRVFWVDKDTGLSHSNTFAWEESAVIEEKWLRRRGHTNIRIVRANGA